MELSERQAEILEQASGLILDLGIQGLTMKNLANRVGISEPALYRHFESKQEILIGVLVSFQEQMKDKVKDVHRLPKRPIQKCIELLRSLVILISEHPSLAAIVFSEEIFHNDDRLRKKILEIMNQHQDVLTDLLQEGQEDGEIRTDLPSGNLALILMGSLRLLVARWRIDGFSFDLPDEGEKLVNNLSRLLADASGPCTTN